MNFAFAFANNSPRRLILVDANTRNPILHHKFSASRDGGLTDVLLEKTSLRNAITQVVPERFYFLQAGQRLNNPVNLYGSTRFVAVMEELQKMADLIIFDSAPIMDSPETTLLSHRTNGLIMVLQAEKTRREVARAAQQDLESARVRVLGAILNKKRQVIPRFIDERL